MTVVAFLREWWGVPLLLSFSCGLLVVLNLALLRDRYIVETKSMASGRWCIAGGHLVRLVAFLAPVVPIEGGDDSTRVLLLGGLVVSYVLHLAGEALIVSDRILQRWYVGPWDGAERRSGRDRRRREEPVAEERRLGERRATVTAPAPLFDPDSELPVPQHPPWWRTWPLINPDFDDRPHHHDEPRPPRG